jgi:hypothetical protein
MPIISAFYGIIVFMYYTDKMKHHHPHIHVKYGEYEAVFTIDEGRLIRGVLPKSKTKLVQAWIEIHNKELLDDWELAINKQQPHKIEPLK